MEMQVISGENYSVEYEPETATVYLKGSLRLSSPADYAPIENLLNKAIEPEPPIITMNLQELQFLNSSGISILSKFLINVRKKKNIQVTISASNGIPWQGKSLKNWQRLVPGLKLEFS